MWVTRRGLQDAGLGNFFAGIPNFKLLATAQERNGNSLKGCRMVGDNYLGGRQDS